MQNESNCPKKIGPNKALITQTNTLLTKTTLLQKKKKKPLYGRTQYSSKTTLMS